jgi:hypothetical protein
MQTPATRGYDARAYEATGEGIWVGGHEAAEGRKAEEVTGQA